jgi:hypothetical protein
MIAFLAGQDWWRRISFIAKVRQQTPPSILSSAATGTSNRLPMRIVGKLPSLAALYGAVTADTEDLSSFLDIDGAAPRGVDIHRRVIPKGVDVV